MVQFNTRANEIVLKLVYYGPGLSGKTTNLQVLHAMCDTENRGELFSVNTQEDRTLFFDLLPLKLGNLYGNAIHVQVYTVPGQVQYDASRRVVLGGADGVVFVADSCEGKMQDNVDSLSNLHHNLTANRIDIKQVPFVLQFNKRDLSDAMPVGVMNRRLNFRGVPFFESVAPKGDGVLETFLAITKETVVATFQKYHLDKKLKDIDALLAHIDDQVRQVMKPQAPRDEAGHVLTQMGTVLRHENVQVSEMAPNEKVESQDLLEDALKSNIETAKLYTELKDAKDQLERKNEELNALYLQLERANQDNLKTRRYLEGLIQSVSEAIISFSQDGRILTWNAAAESMYGWSRSEIVGHPFQKIVPAERNGELETVWEQIRQGQVLRDMHTTRLRKNGEVFPVLITYAPIMGSDDRVLAFSALVRDMAEQKEMEKRLEVVETAANVSQLVPPLFNELANRLAAVSIQKTLILERVTEPELQFRLTRLFQTLEAGQMLLRPLLMVLLPSSMFPKSISINRLAEEAIRKLEMEAAACGVTLDLNLDPTLSESTLDGELVLEALMGLVKAALHASARSSVKRVRLSTRLMGRTQQVICQDTGPARPEPRKGHVFELSHATDLETLEICAAASIFKAHGGSVSVRSQEGVGNAFLFELPLTDTIPAALIGSKMDILQGKKILVVDDEEVLLECLVDAVTGWGAIATPCTLAAEAIQKLQMDTFDLVLSDIRMPGLSGIQLFQWLGTHQPAMSHRILFTTGDAFDPETRTFLEKNLLPHLSKPFDLKQLRKALELLL